MRDRRTYSRDKLKLNKTAQTGSIRDAAKRNSRAHICRWTNALHLRAHKWWLREQKGEHHEYILRRYATPVRAGLSFFSTCLPHPLLLTIRDLLSSFRWLPGLFALHLSSIIPPIFSALLVFSQRISTSMAYCESNKRRVYIYIYEIVMQWRRVMNDWRNKTYGLLKVISDKQKLCNDILVKAASRNLSS